MKWLLISAVAFGLAATAPIALQAQEDQQQQHKGNAQKGSETMGGPHSGPADTNMGGPPGSPPMGGPAAGPNAGPNTGPNGEATRSRPVTGTTVDITKYRRTIVAPRHFSIGIYRAPPGFVYRRWSIGARLPGPFFVRDYWLADFAVYGLVAPPDGFVWVRFGPDAVLVDSNTGEVISVEYGLFI